MKNLNVALLTDGYKLCHAQMHHDGTEYVYSNITPRSTKHYKTNATHFYDNKIVVAGISAAVREVASAFDDFFKSDKDDVIGFLNKTLTAYSGTYNHDMVKRFAELHDLGYLPLSIQGMPEGVKIKEGIPIVTIENTHPNFFWLTNYIESWLSSILWKTCTNATIAAEFKTIAKHYAELTGTDDFTVSVQFHDFSMRGMSGIEDAARSGIGHLMSFIGSDNLAAVNYILNNYSCEGLLACGVPATEHAVATENILHIANNTNVSLVRAEQLFLEDLITNKFPTGLVSYVADSFDYWALITETLPKMKDVITSRQGKLVIRPDTGNPFRIICGYKVLPYEFEIKDDFYLFADYAIGDNKQALDLFEVVKIGGEYFTYGQIDPSRYGVGLQLSEGEVKGTLNCLYDTFGGKINEKGFIELDNHIGLIYGDSISRQSSVQIFERMTSMGFASGNIVLGVGSYTYQSSTRDTLGFAMKATHAVINGKNVDIYKSPKTDSKKNSAKGRLAVTLDCNGDYVLVEGHTSSKNNMTNQFIEYYENNRFDVVRSFDLIRERLSKQ